MARSASCLTSPASKRLGWDWTQASGLWDPPPAWRWVCPLMGAVQSAFVPGTGWGGTEDPKVRAAMRARFSWRPRARPPWLLSGTWLQVGDELQGPGGDKGAGPASFKEGRSTAPKIAPHPPKALHFQSAYTSVPWLHL